MGLIADLKSATIAIDTPLFIYLIEEHPRYLPIVRPLFVALDSGNLAGVTSSLTLLETLVRPYQTGNVGLAEQYEAILTRSRGLSLKEITSETCRVAAQLKAIHGVKTPDALQLATAFLARCSVFVTNDRKLPAIGGLRIVQISQYAR